MQVKKHRHAGKAKHTNTGHTGVSPEQHAANVDKIMTPSSEHNDPRQMQPRDLPSPMGGDHWGTQPTGLDETAAARQW